MDKNSIHEEDIALLTSFTFIGFNESEIIPKIYIDS